MEWLDLAKLVAPLAPTLGGLIGGLIPFPGAGLAGQALGAIVAKQFGVDPTPAAIAGAIKASPDDVAIVKLKAAMEEAKAQWPALAAMEAAREQTAQTQIEQVNATARAELVIESKFKTWWRPMNGWVLAVENAGIGACLVFALSLAMAGNDAPLKMMQAAWPLILAVLGIPAAVVGVAVFSRGQEKIAAMSLGAPLPTAAVPAAPAAKAMKR